MNKSSYLKGLNTVRFILAILVLIGHCNQNLKNYNIFWLNDAPIINKEKLAVDFFFVLSGFLLTYLAYQEIKKYGAINIKNFYARRILRIFPLYYLCVFLGYFLLGVIFPIIKGYDFFDFSISETLKYNLFFLPNLNIAIYQGKMKLLYSLWSIGVEEQFYLFFPFLMNGVIRSKKSIYKLLSIALLFFSFYYYISRTNFSVDFIVLKRFILTLRFHFMFMGSLFALFYIYYADIIKDILKNKIIQSSIWATFLIILFFDVHSYDTYRLFQGTIFCLLIYTVINENSVLNLEVKPFIYLGSLAYGIYMFHTLVSYFIRFLMEQSQLITEVITAFPVIYYTTEIIITIGAAYLSYTYYESYFLNKKHKYQAGK